LLDFLRQVGDRLFIVGGGALCFSFGACFNSVIALNITRRQPESLAADECPLEFVLVASSTSESSDLSSSSSSSTAASSSSTSESTAATVASTAAAAPTVFCQVCTAGFTSRNKLNQHLTASGHRTASLAQSQP
jgi:hypothetical protein